MNFTFFFSAVDECIARLKAANFLELRESDVWLIEPLGKYFVNR